MTAPSSLIAQRLRYTLAIGRVGLATIFDVSKLDLPRSAADRTRRDIEQLLLLSEARFSGRAS